ncbi:MAG: YbaN family protein, partial [Acidobacteria bacterium]|nr:YbaN family protein [Acidobacteriota bacterium]
MTRWKSRFYITIGFIAVGLGVIGIPTPVLPTTPFLLLAAFCFARGSQRWHRWLLTQRTLSPYIIAFREKKGLTRDQKWRIAALVTMTLLVTGAFSPVWQGKALAIFIWVTSMIFLYFSPAAAEETNNQ